MLSSLDHPPDRDDDQNTGKNETHESIAGILILPAGITKNSLCQREHTECMLKITQPIKKGAEAP